MGPAVILGSGRGVLREAAPFLDRYTVCAVNRTGIFLNRMDHWCSVHGDLLESMARIRRQEWDGEKLIPKLEGIQFHSCPRPNLPGWVRQWDFREDGSSGFFATMVMKALGYAPLVLCGMPLADELGEYATPSDTLVRYASYRKVWDETLRGDPDIRATAGYTREIFGPPEGDF